jgi:hypothetical protein
MLESIGGFYKRVPAIISEGPNLGSSVIPSRRLEDRIRELCNLARCVPDESLSSILAALQTALTEYTRRMANKTSATVLSWPDAPGERRKG